MPKAEESATMDEGMSEKPESKHQRKPTNTNGHDCTICRKSNMTLSGLKIHLLTHSGEKPYHCTVCDKRFTCSSNLKKHQRIHNKDYIYECEVCGKTCSDPSNMKKHMTVHSDEKAYVCPSCGKSYSYAQSLRQHMDDVHIGNGEKRMKNKRKGHFPCPECGKVFGYFWRCSLHQARVHAVDKPFKCPECGKSFARETILNKHLQTHDKPYPCTQCDRRFSFRDQLHKHNRIHSGEKPYQCETCLRSFSQRGSLTEHMRTHTGLKPFVCSICGQKFSSSSSLRRHERKVKSCFPAPPGEEFPIGSMFPRKTIYVPTPPVKIARVETAPVVCTQSGPMLQNSYIPSGSASEISTNAENGIYEIPEVETAPIGCTQSSFLVQNNTAPASDPVSQISISNSVFAENANHLRTIPIPKVETAPVGGTQGPQLVQRNTPPTSANVSQISTTKTENTANPTSSTTDNQLGENGNMVPAIVPSNTGQISMVVGCDKNGKIFVVPVSLQLVNVGTPPTGNNHQLLPVTMTTPNNHPPTSGRRLLPKPTSTPVSMTYHPGSIPTQTSTSSEPSFSKPTNTPVTMATSNYHHKETPTQIHQSTSTVPNNTPVAMETSNDHHCGYQNEPNLLADAEAPTMQQHQPTVKPTNNPTKSPSPTNQNTTRNGTILTTTNPSLDIKPVLPRIQHHLSTNQPPTSITRNQPPNNSVTTPISYQTPHSDINNNMVNEVTNYLPVKYSVSTTAVHGRTLVDVPRNNGPGSVELSNTSPSKLDAAINKLNALRCNKPSTMFAETTNVPVKSPVLTTNGYHEYSPANIPLTEDVKPVIGVDVLAFNQRYNRVQTS